MGVGATENFVPDNSANQDFLFQHLASHLPPETTTDTIPKDGLFAWLWSQVTAEFGFAQPTTGS
jgi:hypothetical protein